MYNGDQQAARYLEALFNIKKEMDNQATSIQDQIWIKYYKSYTSDGLHIEMLPQLLTLIHPDFYTKQNISFKQNLEFESKSAFTNGIIKTTHCQSHRLTGINCAFNAFPEMRGKCEADHIWPNSLGGPSILDNRLVLCRYHNGMKSNDISKFPWNQMPSWLDGYLNRIYNLKC
ncbi:HNH endonuclease [Bacillus cereus]|nr:HNH endonuclease [Bacillus cereus]